MFNMFLRIKEARLSGGLLSSTKACEDHQIDIRGRWISGPDFTSTELPRYCCIVAIRPPTSTVTRWGAGVCVFSDMNHFLWPRPSRGMLRRVRQANVDPDLAGAIQMEEQEARSIVRRTKRDGLHHENFRH